MAKNYMAWGVVGAGLGYVAAQHSMARSGSAAQQPYLPFADESKGAKWVREQEAQLLPKTRSVTFHKGTPRQKTVTFSRTKRMKGLSDSQKFVRDYFKQESWPTFEGAAAEWELYKDGDVLWPGER